MRKKRIALIGLRGYPADFPGSGGIDSYVQLMLPQMHQEARHINLFVRSWAQKNIRPSSEDISIAKIPTINTKHLDTPVYAMLATFLVCFSKTDVVWFHAPGSAFLSFLPKLTGKKVYLTIHGLDWKREKWGPVAKWVLKLAERISVKTSDRVFVVSNDLKEYVWEKYKKQSIVMVPEIPKRRTVKPQKIKGLYGLEKENYLLYMGRFVPEKRIEWLVDAFLGSAKLSRVTKLVLAGEAKNDTYTQTLKLKTRKNDQIIWTGYVVGRVKQELLSNCKLFVLPSSIEGYSMALSEALGYRRQCLVTNIKVNRELAKSLTKVTTFRQDSFADFQRKLDEAIVYPSSSRMRTS